MNDVHPIIFIHKNNSDYLEYTLKCAKEFNPDARIILLGDPENEQYKNLGIEHFMYADYEGEESRLFDQLFKYVCGSNHKFPEWLVRFWFKRWFHIYYFGESQQINKFWTFDSDTLILCELKSQVSKFADRDCTDQCNGWCMNGYIGNLQVVRGYLNKINELFQDEEYLDTRKQEYEIEPYWAFTEMAAYFAYKEGSDEIKTTRLNSIIEGETFDDCICQQHEMEMEGTIKKLYSNGAFYVKHLPTQQFVKLNSLNMSWVPTAFIKQVYEDAIAGKRGSVLAAGLDRIIPPEIKNDEFYEVIQKIAREEDIKTVLEIGSSSGQGSTEAFVTGIRENSNQPTLFCMEVSQGRFAELENLYKNQPFVKCYNVSSVSLEQFPEENEVIRFYNNNQTYLNYYPLDQVLGWRCQDMDYIARARVKEKGIQTIKEENKIEFFDVVLIDGSEFTGKAELKEIYGAKFILLDDINAFKNYENFQTLAADPNYYCLIENRNVRNGYAVFKKKIELAIHFLTIVLNGQPFIRYHLEIFKKLSFKWHWHIVEGVADLKHDTAWSLHLGGKITNDFHCNGRSIDGTSQYLDELSQLYPENVTVYRKAEGVFWEGKRDMVNAPLANIKEEGLLWQVDVDELWTVDQICNARQMFLENPEKTAAFYWCWYFVGENLVISTRNCYAQNPQQEWLRTWRFKPGAVWAAHEPPRLVEPMPNGEWRDVVAVNPFVHEETEKRGLVFQHFAYVTAEQLQFKEQYYGYKNAVSQWMELQPQTQFPVKLRNYFAWVQDETAVDTAESCGVTPLARREKDNSWHFRQPEKWQTPIEVIEKVTPRIVVDGVFFQILKTGIARVWRALLEEWVAMDFAKHIVVLDRAGTAPRIKGIEYCLVPAYDYSKTDSDREMLQQMCDRLEADLFISTYYTTPVTTPSVFLAHDMIPEIFGINLDKPMWREKHFGIRHASAFIAVSKNTAADLLKFFPEISPDIVTVAHNGVGSNFSPASVREVNHFKIKYGIAKPYFLLVGVGDVYKNEVLFFQAFARLSKREEFDIIWTTSSHLTDEYKPDTLGITVHWLLQLNDRDLISAYSGAVALIYPSKYEGFGLPVLEAMACGCPVITCPNTSIPEVAGEAALYVSDDDVEGMIDALEDVQKSQVRNKLIGAGIEQAKKFSWSKMAITVSSVLINSTLQSLNFKKINLIIFPDWKKLESALCLDLEQIIRTLIEHPDRSKITLLIDSSNISEEEATLVLSGIMMNILMGGDLEVNEEEPALSIIRQLSESQWSALFSKIYARILLDTENTDMALRALKAPALTVDMLTNMRFERES